MDQVLGQALATGQELEETAPTRPAGLTVSYPEGANVMPVPVFHSFFIGGLESPTMKFRYRRQVEHGPLRRAQASKGVLPPMAIPA